jgi:hypothetical protein
MWGERERGETREEMEKGKKKAAAKRVREAEMVKER